MPSRFYQNVISRSRPMPGQGQVVEIPKPTTVVDEPTTTVVDRPETTVVADQQLQLSPLAPCGEPRANGALFPPSRGTADRTGAGRPHAFRRVRVRHSLGAQEHRQGRNPADPIGYTHIARQARITRRNAALIVERLIEKGFVQLDRAGGHPTPDAQPVIGCWATGRPSRSWGGEAGNGWCGAATGCCSFTR